MIEFKNEIEVWDLIGFKQLSMVLINLKWFSTIFGVLLYMGYMYKCMSINLVIQCYCRSVVGAKLSKTQYWNCTLFLIQLIDEMANCTIEENIEISNQLFSIKNMINLRHNIFHDHGAQHCKQNYNIVIENSLLHCCHLWFVNYFKIIMQSQGDCSSLRDETLAKIVYKIE